MTAAAAQHPCLLCGSVHEVRIHAWCERLVRCADGRNHRILILSCICEEARRQGKQYTKRMLPWFVIPECNIRLDLVLNLHRLVARHPKGPEVGMKLAYERAAGVIGSICEHTIARHLEWVRQLIAANVLEAGKLMAELASFAELPEVRAGGSGLAELHRYLVALALARRRAVGRGGVLGVIGCLHLCYVVVRTRSPLTTIESILRYWLWFDTEHSLWRHQRGCDTGFSPVARLEEHLATTAAAGTGAPRRGWLLGSSAACICATWWCARAARWHYH